MNKAGIITLYGNTNYGNKLQNYAVQEMLKKFGLDVATIIYIGKDEHNLKFEKDFDKNKLKAFDYFNRNINYYDQKLYVDKEISEEFGKDLDYFVIGSDQVWNYTFWDIFSPKIFASFANENQKRVAFSASVGVSTPPENNSKEYKIFEDNLKNMDYISVREEAGKEIIEGISGRNDVKVLLDPTMLIHREEWEKVTKKPDFLKTDNFVVKSFLGNTGSNVEKEIEKYAKENNYEIIDISDKNSPYFNIGPAEFLYLEKNAKMVVTDSFHSCVFAILFSTPFIVFKRDDRLTSMYSRIETLVKTFGLENRIFAGEITEEMKSDNYNDAYSILEDKREECMNYLSKVFA